MRKHTKEELNIMARRLTKGEVDFKKEIKSYIISERKYLEKKCKFYNLESITKVKSSVQK